MLAERGLKYGGIGPIHWNCFNCELYLCFLQSSNCKASFSIIYTASYLIFRYSLNVIPEIFRSRANNLIYFLNACTVGPLRPFHDQRFLNYTVRILNSWYPGYLSNHESFDSLIKVVTVKGWGGLSARFKLVWNSLKGLLALKRFPDFFFILGTSLKNSIAVREAFELAIPVTGIVSPDTATSELYLPLRWPVSLQLVNFYLTVFYESIYYGLFKIFSDEFSLLIRDQLIFNNAFSSKLGELALMKYRRRSLLSHWSFYHRRERIVGTLRALCDQFVTVSTRFRYKWIFFFKTILYSIESTLIRKSSLTHCLGKLNLKKTAILNYKFAALQAFHVFKYLKLFSSFFFHSKMSFQNFFFQQGINYKFSSFIRDAEWKNFVCRDRRDHAWLLNIWNMHFARCWKSFKFLLQEDYREVIPTPVSVSESEDSFYVKNFKNDVKSNNELNIKYKRRSFFFRKAVKSLFFAVNVVRSKYIRRMPRLFVSGVINSFQRAVMPVHTLLWEKVSELESELIAKKKIKRLAIYRHKRLFSALRIVRGLSKRRVRLNSRQLLRGSFVLDNYFMKRLRLWIRPHFNFGKALSDLMKDLRADSSLHELYHPKYAARLSTVVNARARASYRKRIPSREVWKNACMPFKWTGRTASEFALEIKKLLFFKEPLLEGDLLKRAKLNPFAPFSDPFDIRKEIEMIPIRRATFKNLNFEQAWKRTLFFLHLFSEVRTEGPFTPNTDDLTIYFCPLNHDFGDHFYGMKWKKPLTVFNPIRKLLSTLLYRARFLRNMKQDLVWQRRETWARGDSVVLWPNVYHDNCDWQHIIGIRQNSYSNVLLGGGIGAHFVLRFLKKVFYRVLWRKKDLACFSNSRLVSRIVKQGNFLVSFLQKLYLKSNLLLVISRLISMHFWSLNFPLYLSPLFFKISPFFLRINLLYVCAYAVFFRHLVFRALSSYMFLIYNCELFFSISFLLHKFIVKFIANNTLEKDSGSWISKFINLITQMFVWSFEPLNVFVDKWITHALFSSFSLISLKAVLAARLFNCRIVFIPLFEFFKNWNGFHTVFLEGMILSSYKVLALFQQYQKNKAALYTIARFSRFRRVNDSGTLLKSIMSHSVGFAGQFRIFNDFGLYKNLGFSFLVLGILKTFFILYFYRIIYLLWE